MPSRRSQTKSHHGCSQCKNRRIKCDELRPICGSCQKKGLLCSLKDSLSSPSQSPREHEQRPRDQGISALPLVELELLHHWHTATAVSLIENEALSEVLQTQVPIAGLSYPFVMHGILAISALHLSQQCSGSRHQQYIDIGMRHHSDALSLFVPLLSNVTPENCRSLFACSFLISGFSFASHGLNTKPSSIHVSEVIEAFKLVRGTASIVEKARPWIEQGDMRLLLGFTRSAQTILRSRLVHEVHARLEELVHKQADQIRTSQLPTILATVVTASTQHLLEIFDSSIASDNQVTVLAWPAVIDSLYLDILQQIEPCSLVTLAHYGAVLHIMTNAWWMEGWGKFLVNVAAANLYDIGRSAIAWPLAVVNENAVE